MTVSASNGNSSIMEFAKQYEDQLLLEEEQKKNVSAVGGQSQSNAFSGITNKVGTEDDKKNAAKKDAVGEKNKTDFGKIEQKNTAEANSAQKADTIKKQFATDSVNKMVNTQKTVGTVTLGACMMENVTMTKQEAINAYNTGVKIATVMNNLVGQCGGNLANLSSEDLLAAFMKIQLDDPAKKTETLNDLNDCMKSLRQLSHKSEEAAIQRQEVEQNEAIKKSQEAKGYAAAMKVFKIVAIVVLAVAAVVATAATCGGASAMVPLIVGCCIAIAVAGVTTASISMKEAANNYEAAKQAKEATDAQLDAMDFERVKEVFQEMIGDNQEMIQALMESFNNFCGLLKTLIDRQASSVKVLSDATMR